jgi:hypothetical protein
MRFSLRGSGRKNEKRRKHKPNRGIHGNALA